MKILHNNRILIALMLSGMVHGVLLYVSEQKKGDAPVDQLASVTVQVELTRHLVGTDRKKLSDNKSMEKLVAIDRNNDTSLQQDIIRQADPVVNNEVQKPVEAHVISDYSDVRSDNQYRRDGERSDELRKYLHEAINRKKHYPYIARKQRREGLVKINFIMHPDGKVTDIAIVQSSRFAILDRAAKNAVEAISPFQLASEYLTMQQRYDVGIDFRLN